MIKLYTDGGGPCKKRMTAAAFIVQGLKEQPIRLVCTLGDRTNNQAELSALLVALSFLHKFPKTLDSGIIWFSDSQYVIRGGSGWVHKWVENGWKGRKSPIKNVQLWQTYLQLSRDVNIQAHHLKGHTGHKENELCDRACRWAIHKSNKDNKELVSEVSVRYRKVPYEWKFFRGEPLVEAWLQGDLGADYLKRVFKELR